MIYFMIWLLTGLVGVIVHYVCEYDKLGYFSFKLTDFIESLLAMLLGAITLLVVLKDELPKTKIWNSWKNK